MKKEIEINLIHEGLHCWPNAFKAVSYLRDTHRHLFYITMCKEVSHNDRDIEFIDFKHKAQEYLSSFSFDLGSMSCEMLAEDLLNKFNCSYVRVSEDNELGARIWR